MRAIIAGLVLLLLATPTFAAQQVLEDGASMGTQRAKINANDAELYAQDTAQDAEIAEKLEASDIDTQAEFEALLFELPEGASSLQQYSKLELTTDTSISEAQIQANGFITNREASDTVTATIPSLSYPWKMVAATEEAEVFKICPPSSSASFDLNGTTLDDGNCVSSPATVGEIASIVNLQRADDSWYQSIVSALGTWTESVTIAERPASTAILDTSNYLTDNLILAWILAEGTGTTVEDYSGNDYEGTISGTADWTDSNDPSAGITYLTSDGYVNNAVRAYTWPNTEIQISQNRTVIVKLKISGSNTRYQFFNYGVQGGVDNRFSLATYDSKLAVEQADTEYVYGSTDITTDEWVVVAAVLDGTDLSDIALYVNGEAETETVVGDTAVTTLSGEQTGGDIFLGDALNRNLGLEGETEFLYVFDVALTASEIADISNSPYQIFD